MKELYFINKMDFAESRLTLRGLDLICPMPIQDLNLTWHVRESYIVILNTCWFMLHRFAAIRINRKLSTIFVKCIYVKYNAVRFI